MKKNLILKTLGLLKSFKKKKGWVKPIDKKEHIIKARKVIVFKISNKLKKEINNE